MIQLIPLLFVILIVVATVTLGVWSTRKSQTASDFFVAGRQVSVFWNASAISGEYLSAASFMGIAGLIMKNGYDALWYPVGYAAGYLFLLLFIAGPLRRFGAYTIPDFAEGRFDSVGFRKIAVIFVLFIGFFYTMPQMKGAGVTMATILNWPYWAGILVVGTVITFNVAVGGMKGITIVQAFQYWVKVFAISLPFFVLASVLGLSATTVTDNLEQPKVVPTLIEATTVKVNGKDKAPSNVLALSSVGQTKLTFPEGAEIAALTTVVKLKPGQHLPPVMGDLNGQPVLGTTKTLSLKPGDVFSASVFSLLDDNGQPIVEQGKTLKTNVKLEFEKAAKVSMAEGTSVPNAPANSKWTNPYGPLTSKWGYPVLYTFSLIIALVCGTAGLPHILVRFYTNPDGKAAKKTTLWVMVMLGGFYVFTPLWGLLGRSIIPSLYASGGFDSLVIKLPTLLPDKTMGLVLSGVTSAGAFAAFMSTFSGLLVSMSGAFAHDVYGKIIRPDASPESRLLAFKIAAVVVGIVSMLLGLLVESYDIAMMVGWAFAIGAASYFPLLLLGAWWRGLTKYGAAAGMLVGGTLSLLAIVTSMLLDRKVLTMNLPPLTRALMEQPAIWGVPLSIFLMVVVSKMTSDRLPPHVDLKILRLHAPEEMGVGKNYIEG